MEDNEVKLEFEHKVKQVKSSFYVLGQITGRIGNVVYIRQHPNLRRW